jgi:hypothetical protein
VRDLVAQGRLVELFPEWVGESHSLYALYPSRHFPAVRVGAFIDFVIEIVDADGAQLAYFAPDWRMASNVRLWPPLTLRHVTAPNSRCPRAGSPAMARNQTGEPRSVRPGGFRKSTDKLSENPSPCRPKATRAVFEEI